MPETSSFVSFVLDQLSGLDEIRARAMFGGTGLYCGAVFFGIAYRDVLYLKVNDNTRSKYERAGMKPFKPFAGRPSSMHYYEVPLAVLEDARDLTVWAKLAIDAASDRTPKRRVNRSQHPARHR